MRQIEGTVLANADSRSPGNLLLYLLVRGPGDSLVHGGLHPPVLQFPSLAVVLGPVGGVGLAEAHLGEAVEVVGDGLTICTLHICPLIFINQFALQGQLHRHVGELRLIGRRLPGLGDRHGDRIRQAVGDHAAVVNQFVAGVTHAIIIGDLVAAVNNLVVVPHHAVDGLVVIVPISIYHLLPDPVDVGVAVGVVLGESIVTGNHVIIVFYFFWISGFFAGIVGFVWIFGIFLIPCFAAVLRNRIGILTIVSGCQHLHLGGGPIALIQPVPVKGEGHVRAGFQPRTRVLVQPDFLRPERSLAGQDELEGAAVVYRIGVRSVVVHSAVVVQRLEVVLLLVRQEAAVLPQIIRRQTTVCDIFHRRHAVLDGTAVQVVLPQAGDRHFIRILVKLSFRLSILDQVFDAAFSGFACTIAPLELEVSQNGTDLFV